jgi:hypothetical protein
VAKSWSCVLHVVSGNRVLIREGIKLRGCCGRGAERLVSGIYVWGL